LAAILVILRRALAALVLYAISELGAGDSPAVNSYRIADDYSLEQQMQQPVDGGCPCHISLIEGQLVVACYETGNVVQYPVGDDGVPLASVANHHRVRHMIVSQDGQVAYAINELTAQISILLAGDEGFEQQSVISSLPSNYQGEPSGSAIRLHPTQPLLYVANRGLEAITIFRLHAESVELVDYQYTGGQELREFNISPCGQWLVACHQNSHDTVVYKIQPQGLLSEHYRTKKIKSPACMSFLHQPQTTNSAASL